MIIGPGGYYPVKYQYNPRMTGIPCKDCVEGHRDLVFTEKHIYALFSGKKYNDRDSHGCEEIHVFNLNWKPEKRIQLPFMVTSMQYDPMKKTLFTISPFRQNPISYFRLED